MSTTTKKLSGTITTSASGTAVVLGNGFVGRGVWLHALSSNSGSLYIGNDGSNNVSSTTGFCLEPNNTILLDYVYDLSQIYVDASGSGQKLSYIEVETSHNKE